MPRLASVEYGGTRPAHSQVAMPPHFVGIVLAAGGCALFWTAMLAIMGPTVGIDLDGAALAVIGAAIALFLTAVLHLLPDEN